MISPVHLIITCTSACPVLPVRLDFRGMTPFSLNAARERALFPCSLLWDVGSETSLKYLSPHPSHPPTHTVLSEGKKHYIYLLSYLPVFWLTCRDCVPFWTLTAPLEGTLVFNKGGGERLNLYQWERHYCSERQMKELQSTTGCSVMAAESLMETVADCDVGVGVEDSKTLGEPWGAKQGTGGRDTHARQAGPCRGRRLNLYEWEWHYCSEGRVKPLQTTANLLSVRVLVVWQDDWLTHGWAATPWSLKIHITFKYVKITGILFLDFCKWKGHPVAKDHKLQWHLVEKGNHYTPLSEILFTHKGGRDASFKLASTQNKIDLYVFYFSSHKDFNRMKSLYMWKVT